ncbi:MAG: hypothetical protein IT160_09995 [Bryobacterales bacterium]|nr:hypothetical protein [Bryobacterales bacterium]
MKKTYRIVFVLLASGVAFAESHPSLDLETSALSQYVWRGIILTNGPLLQTSATADYRGVHLNILANNDLESSNGRRGEFSELDYEIGYDHHAERATLSCGLIHYTFPSTHEESTTELYAGAGFAVPLHPSVKVYSDVGAIHGTYVSFDLAHSIALPKLGPNKPWSAEFSAGAGAASKGFNRGYYGVERAGVVDFHPAIALPVSLGSRIRLTPRVGYSGVASSLLRPSEAPKAHNFYFGVSLLFHI